MSVEIDKHFHIQSSTRSKIRIDSNPPPPPPSLSPSIALINKVTCGHFESRTAQTPHVGFLPREVGSMVLDDLRGHPAWSSAWRREREREREV
jgi:hypothetical protein